MEKTLVLFNPKAGQGGEAQAHKLDVLYNDKSLEYCDITTVKDWPGLFETLTVDDTLIICGGDGTLNRFINDTDRAAGFDGKLLYYSGGTGNDFMRDIGLSETPIDLRPYITRLPVVTVNDKKYYFLNNVGFGIDGYCTLVGDQKKAAGETDINYAGIAIGGMLGGFKPTNAQVTVDGVTTSYKKAWLAPTMNGRYYGGGMMAAPEQDRMNAEHTVSCMLFFGKGKLKTLCVFPSIFKGEHVKHKEMVTVLTGHEIKVVFERPCPLQIDGETIPDVTEYTVVSE